MARIVRLPYVVEVAQLIRIFQRAEEQLLETLSYKYANELVTYGEDAALDRVQKILADLRKNSAKTVSVVMRKQFLLGKKIAVGKAAQLTSLNTQVIERLTRNLNAKILESTIVAEEHIKQNILESLVIGRRYEDAYRDVALESTAIGQASGLGRSESAKIFLEKMKEDGITGFTDVAGRNWRLSRYADMTIRTTARQAANAGTMGTGHDLFEVSSHGTTCKICAPLEGRVFSVSGTNPNYPPITEAFGKVDPFGGDGLENTWLNIHPNCLHVWIEYHEEYHTEEEVIEKQQFSSISSNPITLDPRSKAEKDAYENKEKGREKLINASNQFDRYKVVLGDDMPKTFQTFLKHKVANSDKYKSWEKLYRERNREIKTKAV